MSDYTEKNSNLIPQIDIPCFAWNSQAEQGLLFFKAKSLKKKDFYWRNWAICEEQRAISDKRLCNENIMIIM